MRTRESLTLAECTSFIKSSGEKVMNPLSGRYIGRNKRVYNQIERECTTRYDLQAILAEHANAVDAAKSAKLQKELDDQRTIITGLQNDIADMKSNLSEVTKNMLIMHDKYSSVLQKVGKHGKQIAKCEKRIQHIKAIMKKTKKSTDSDAPRDATQDESTQASMPRMIFKAQKTPKKEGVKRKSGKAESNDLRGPKVNRVLVNESNMPFAHKKRKRPIRLKRKHQSHHQDIDTPKRVRTDEE